ncbi:hypothetical protein EXN66_Car019785 [Channa argus]|uniref:Uncharacterized protein n=1 Tax=Channa argus TaxID=215402 RepID=A0A6G1QNP7_CHAAH|nr:hypothetical protein EXN66_Car019785 [Channa argus]
MNPSSPSWFIIFTVLQSMSSFRDYGDIKKQAHNPLLSPGQMKGLYSNRSLATGH